MPKTIVIGAGLVGSLLSMFLAKKGYQVEVFDGKPDPRKNNLNSGRSINLTLCERGLKVLDSIGAGQSVRALAVPVYGRLIHDLEGNLTFQPYGNHREAIYSIARNELNKVLLDFAEQRFGIDFSFQQKCLDVDFITPTAELKNQVSGQTTRHQAERIFGADGAYSAVRLQIQKKIRFNFSQQYWAQGYKELEVPASVNKTWTSEKNVIHIWPRGNYMLLGFPNLDGSFTCSLHLPFEGPLSFASLRTEEDLLRLFRDSFADAFPLMPQLVNDFFGHPANSMVTIKCSPWSYQDKVALIGDAAHSIFPSYGQGANAGFEDCAALSECMDEYGENWTRVLTEFEKQRRPNTDAIADLCVEHFCELRDLVGNPGFLLRKKIERKLNQVCPEKYLDLYSMISFTQMPYTEALRLDREQRAIVEQIMNVDEIEEKLNGVEADCFIESFIAPSLTG
jgi:kynurenine 3-monooxygenase